MPVQDQTAVAARLHDAFAEARRDDRPYTHWSLVSVLPETAARAVTALPFAPARIGDTQGKRDTHNSTRIFFSAENRARYPVCEEIAAALQDPAMIARIQAMCGVDLARHFLRIEYCQDLEGFWLEPHTDIGAKSFTFLIYLSEGEGSEHWGTDIYDQDRRFLGSVHAPFNTGMIFVPASDTWHGFERRPITGTRKVLIVNYVKPEWRARHELAYPERPVA